MDGQLIQYLPVLILLGVAIAFAAGNLIVSKLIGKRAHTDEVKDTPYECGMLPEGAGSTRMSVKFYLIAMLFILFDIEVVFLCLLYTSPSPRDGLLSRMPSSA